MRRLLLFLILLLCGTLFADKKANLGGFDGFVERMGTGGRELGRGNVGVADTSALPAAYFNPAILGFRNTIAYTLAAEKRDLDLSLIHI